jgi:hypothetical protein
MFSFMNHKLFMLSFTVYVKSFNCISDVMGQLIYILLVSLLLIKFELKQLCTSSDLVHKLNRINVIDT